MVGRSERHAGRLRDEVLVRDRDDGHADACEPADLRRVHPAGVDDDLGLDVAAVGLDAADAATRTSIAVTRVCV